MMKSILPASRKHDVSFYASGRIDISAHIARRLSLAPGDVIGIALDGGEMYIYVKLRAGHYSGRHVGRVYATSHGRGTFRTSAKALARAVLDAAAVKSGCLRCPCGADIVRNNYKFISIIFHHSL